MSIYGTHIRTFVLFWDKLLIKTPLTYISLALSIASIKAQYFHTMLYKHTPISATQRVGRTFHRLLLLYSSTVGLLLSQWRFCTRRQGRLRECSLQLFIGLDMKWYNFSGQKVNKGLKMYGMKCTKLYTFIIRVMPRYNSTCLQHIISGYRMCCSVDFLVPLRVPYFSLSEIGLYLTIFGRWL